MLSTETALYLTVTVSFLSLCLALLCVWNARRAQSYAANCENWMRRVAEMRDPTAKIAELSGEMTELADSYSALLKSHRKLRSRISMRENREKGGADPASDLSSERDKRQLRLAAKSAGLLK